MNQAERVLDVEMEEHENYLYLQKEGEKYILA